MLIIIKNSISIDGIKANILTQAISADSDKIIDITATYHRFISIMVNILTTHTFFGCDTVGSYFEIGKSPVVDAFKKVIRIACLNWRIRQKGLTIFYPTTKRQKLTALRKQEGRYANTMCLKIIHQHQK